MPGPLSSTTTRNFVGWFGDGAGCTSTISTRSSGRMPASSQASRELSTASFTVVRSALAGLSKPSRCRFLVKNSLTEISRWRVAMDSAVARRLGRVASGASSFFVMAGGTASGAGERVSSSGEGASGSFGGVIRRPTLVLALLTALNLLNYLDRFVLSAVLPKVQDDLHLSNFVGGSLATVFLIGYFATSPVFGQLADRAGAGGRARLLAAGIAVWSAATVASGLVAGTASLVAARALVGVGEASYATIAPTLLDDLAPAERKGRWMAIFYSATPIGSALGYIVGGRVESATGSWRAAFFVAGVPGIAPRGPVPAHRRAAPGQGGCPPRPRGLGTQAAARCPSSPERSPATAPTPSRWEASPSGPPSTSTRATASSPARPASGSAS